MKKTLKTIVLTVIMLIVLCVSAFAFEQGDVNGDGKVKVTDARLALRASANIEKLSEEQMSAADLDGNGKVTPAEARTILRVAASLERFDWQTKPEDRKPLTQEELADIAHESTVKIDISFSQGKHTAIGFFISDDGLILTNYSTFDTGDLNAELTGISVTTSDGNTYTIDKIEAYSKKYDLVILKIDTVSKGLTLTGAFPEKDETVYIGTYYYSPIFTNTVKEKIDDRIYFRLNSNQSSLAGCPVFNEYGEVCAIGSRKTRSEITGIPVLEVDMLDTDSPVSLLEFALAVAGLDNATITVYGSEITLKPNGTAFVAVVCENMPLMLSYCSTEGKGIIKNSNASYLKLDENTDVWIVGVSAVKSSGSETLRVGTRNFKDVYAEINVTVSSEGGSDYAGIFGSIPDLGVNFGIEPTFTGNCEMGFECSYCLTLIEKAGYTMDTLFSEYTKLLEKKGFTFIGYDETEYSQTFYFQINDMIVVYEARAKDIYSENTDDYFVRIVVIPAFAITEDI